MVTPIYMMAAPKITGILLSTFFATTVCVHTTERRFTMYTANVITVSLTFFTHRDPAFGAYSTFCAGLVSTDLTF